MHPDDTWDVLEGDPPPNWPATIALPGVVSEGTLNPEHLIPVFAKLVHELDYELYRNSTDWCSRCLDRAMAGELGGHSSGLLDPDDQLSVLENLYEALDELAPPGYRFGGHEGDPACIGFFEDPSYEKPDHQCVIQETPDGMGCPTCLYC